MLTLIAENLAFQKAVSQSTTINSGVASKAVDGNTSGLWASSSITHTAENEPTPSWWVVDLGQQAKINYVNVFNRTDACCSARLINYYLQVSKVPFEQATPAGITTFPQSQIAGSPTRITIDGKGRYVRIQQIQPNLALSMAEMEVIRYFEGASTARVASELLPHVVWESAGDEPSFIISPNPAVDMIRLHTAKADTHAIPGQLEEVLVVDSFGHVVKHVKPGKTQETILHIGDLPTGIYVIRIFDGTRWHSKKLVGGK